MRAVRHRLLLNAVSSHCFRLVSLNQSLPRYSALPRYFSLRTTGGSTTALTRSLERQNFARAVSRQLSDGKNREVKVDDTVRVNLRMGLMDKRMITPKEGTIVEFKVGMNQLLIPKIETEVMGMKVAQRKDFICSAAEAFGDINVALMPFIPAQDLPQTYQKDLELPENYQPLLQRLHKPKDMQHEVSVIAVTDKGVTLDLNHPRAGHPILVSVYLLGIS